MIKYPGGMKKNAAFSSAKVSTSNRGSGLEDDINSSNQYFLDLDLAVVHKKPTPIQVVDVHYPTRNRAQITKAYYTKPSTTDYNGIYRGRAIDFEAKQSKSKTSFSLSLIHDHQIKHLERVIKHDGIAFLIIRFTSLDETYYVEAQKIIPLYYSEKKSIAYSWFQQHGHLIPFSLTPPVNYLNVIDKLYFEGEVYER